MMKINTGSVFPKNFDIKAGSRKESGAAPKQAQGKNFDAIIIDDGRKAVPENEFLNMLKNKVAAELKTPAQPQKIAAIRTELAEGSYKVNPQETARKIMIGL